MTAICVNFRCAHCRAANSDKDTDFICNSRPVMFRKSMEMHPDILECVNFVDKGNDNKPVY